MEMVKEPSGEKKISSTRCFLAIAIISYLIVFLVWLGVTAGLFLDLWEWTRFSGAIVSGGLGLLGVIFGAVGGYAANRFTSLAPSVPSLGEEGREWIEDE
jgi:protein-S-isoprenylcysteine O-methyltransferase Ste14